jgi:hypothetical protein
MGVGLCGLEIGGLWQAGAVKGAAREKVGRGGGQLSLGARPSAIPIRFEFRKDRGNCPSVVSRQKETFLRFPSIIVVKMWTQNGVCGRANSLF